MQTHFVCDKNSFYLAVKTIATAHADVPWTDEALPRGCFCLVTALRDETKTAAKETIIILLSFSTVKD